MATIKELTAVAVEMNKVMGLSPKIKTNGVTEKALKKEIIENAEEIDLENDEFSDGTIEVLTELECWPGKVEKKKAGGKATPAAPAKGKKPAPAPVEEDDDDDDDDEPEADEDEDEDEEDLSLEDRLKAAKSMDDHKEIQADFPDIFTKKVCKTFEGLKNPIMLKKAMKDAAGIEAAAPVAKEKKEKNPKFEKPEYNRVDSISEALLKKPKTMAEWIKSANELMESNGGKANDNENKFIIKYFVKMSKHFDFGVKLPE